MRFVPLAALLLLALPATGLPARARAAEVPCGQLKGAAYIAGRAYVGEMVWPTQTLKVTVEFKANCDLIVTPDGKPAMKGDWAQAGQLLIMGSDSLEFDAGLDADGTMSGEVLSDRLGVGHFLFKPRP